MKQIQLGVKGQWATLVDDSDFPAANQFIWHRHKGRTTWYASRLAYKNGIPRRVYLHRELLGAAPKTQVDHEDGNGLNNQRFNLRSASNSQNHQAKMSRPSHFRSRFRGVYWHSQNENWCAQIKKDYKKTHLGSFSDERLAAKAYDEAALVLFGPFAQLNFPNEHTK